MTTFSSIHLYQWRQFASISINFHPRLTIITGANGAGKSTILNICAQHFGLNKPFLATPIKKKGGGIVYDFGYHNYSSPYFVQSDFFKEMFDKELEQDDDDEFGLLAPPFFEEEGPRNISANLGSFIQVGSISYENGAQSTVGFHENQASSYGLQINHQQQVLGVPISSHRTISAYQPVQGLSLQLANLTAAYQAFTNEYFARLNGSYTQFSPLYRMKETLITMAAFGEGNRYLEKNLELSSAFHGFSTILRRVLPKEMGFQQLTVRIPDVVLVTRSGEFILDASSGGVSAVIEIAWQLYLYSLTNKSFSATLDEPENHLHPSMQRSILSNLIDAFPQVQFIVATHSPFIVSAVEDSSVYALKYMGTTNQSGFPSSGPRRVRSIALDQTSKAGSASEILKDVLGVSVTIPEWATKRLQAIVAEFEGAEITADSLLRLRSKLSDSGFSEYYPEALARLVEGK